MTLCLIAGQGVLPGLLVGTLDAAGAAFMLAELDGYPMAGRGAHPVVRFRIEHLGSFIEDLLAQGVTRVCFAGAIRRPPVDPAAVNSATAPFVPRLLDAMAQGDDAVLRCVLALFEASGLAVIGAHELMPGLLPSGGVLTRVSPDGPVAHDAVRGAGIVAAMGAADVGQACVVARGQALGTEGWGGTDWMLATVAAARDAGSPLFLPDMPPGGILFKAPKPGQDRRVDLPAIGPGTVRGAIAAGLAGIVIEAGGVMVFGCDDVIATADRAGLFVWVRTAT